jgi:hypothetical protein
MDACIAASDGYDKYVIDVCGCDRCSSGVEARRTAFACAPNKIDFTPIGRHELEMTHTIGKDRPSLSLNQAPPLSS